MTPVAEGSIFKRCTCRDPMNGKLTGRSCPKLRRRGGAWNPEHGSWHLQLELPRRRNGSRRHLRRGGFPTRDAAQDELDHARALLAIPPTEDGETRTRIGDLIEEATKNGGPLPDHWEVRRRVRVGVPLLGLPTVADWLDQWLSTKKRIRRSTWVSYEGHIRRYYKPHLGHLRVDQLRVSHVADLFDWIDEHNERIREARASQDPELRAKVKWQRVVGPASKQRIRATLRAALNDAITHQLITFNPAAHVELPAGRPPKPLVWTHERVTQWRNTGQTPSPVMVWTPEQTGAFLDHTTDDPLYALYHLIAYRGLRRGEACGLHWADLDLDAQTLTVRWQLVLIAWQPELCPPKSEAGDRVVPLDSTTTAVLKAHRKRQHEQQLAAGPAWENNGLVFTDPLGRPLNPSDATDHFNQLLAAADLPPIRLHGLRHGAATLALAAGADMKIIQTLLGHSTLAVTADTYTSVLPQLARDTAEATARIIPRTAAH